MADSIINDRNDKLDEEAFQKAFEEEKACEEVFEAEALKCTHHIGMLIDRHTVCMNSSCCMWKCGHCLEWQDVRPIKEWAGTKAERWFCCGECRANGLSPVYW
jgi:hypothetical protein